MKEKSKRIVSGMRPTGRVHLGHFIGALNNWVRLQDEGYECFFFAADWHALTSDWQDAGSVETHVREMAVDWLACGLDPERSTLFVQSWVKPHAELFLLLSMITPLGWLERNPTYKEMRKEITNKDLSNLGFLGYPVLQTADIALYKGEAVPVGVDQVPHLELSREIVRRFNNTYRPVFPEPQAMLTEVPKIGGIDGRKMSKSYDNAIFLCDPEAEIRKKVKVMVTDPKRARRQDPGDPDTCNLFPLHRAFSAEDTIFTVRKGCTSAGIGCVDCKNMLLASMLPALAPVREKREALLGNPGLVNDLLGEGSRKAGAVAERVMQEVREAVALAYE